jgi:predicted NBD/HSP70 family sugar kinase
LISLRVREASKKSPAAQFLGAIISEERPFLRTGAASKKKVHLAFSWLAIPTTGSLRTPMGQNLDVVPLGNALSDRVDIPATINLRMKS